MRMPRMYRVAPVLMLSLLALSCSKHEVAPADADMAAASAPAMEEMVADAAAAAAPQKNLDAPAPQAPGVAASQLASDVLAQTDPQRRFIRTAAAEFQVKDVYRTALAIEDEVAKQGGSSSTTTSRRRCSAWRAGRSATACGGNWPNTGCKAN